MHPTITFNLVSSAAIETRPIQVQRTIIAGWTGSDEDAMEQHIAELEKLGVARPVRTPMFYRVAAWRITTDSGIEAIGNASSGEVEFVLVNFDDQIWIGVGSDHIDRKMETRNVTLSKQLCDKPVGDALWRLDEVLPHWEQLKLRSHVTIDCRSTLYQEGFVTAMLEPDELLGIFAKEDSRGGT